MDAGLKQLIHDRLDAEGADAAWVYQVLAACEGRDALDQQLGGAKPAQALDTALHRDASGGAARSVSPVDHRRRLPGYRPTHHADPQARSRTHARRRA